MNPSTRITSLQYYATLSYQRLSSKTSWVSSFNGIGVSLGISVPFSITDTLAVLLELEGGANVYLVYGDVEGCGEQDLTPFIDPVIGSATTFLIGTEDGFQFMISPGLFWLFEKGAIGQIATLDIGLRANL